MLAVTNGSHAGPRHLWRAQVAIHGTSPPLKVASIDPRRILQRPTASKVLSVVGFHQRDDGGLGSIREHWPRCEDRGQDQAMLRH
jgi:hypothetical protein